MLPIQAKPVSRSAQFGVAKVVPQVGASQTVCQRCINACNMIIDPTARAICVFGCFRTGACP